MSFIFSLLGKAAGFAALGPFASVLSVLWGGIKTLIAWVWEALELAITHPVIWLLLFIVWGIGVHNGKAWDAHLVEAARIDTANVVAKVKGAELVEAQKATAAIAARDAAKIQPLMDPESFAIVAPVSPVNADHPVKASVPTIALNPARPDFVRPGNTNHRRAKCDAVFCF